MGPPRLTRIGTFGQFTLELVEVVAVPADDALGVEDDDVLHTGGEQYVQATPAAPAPGDDDLLVGDVAPRDRDRPRQCGQGHHDGGAVLVVV